MLDINSPVQYNDTITGLEYHSHSPFQSNFEPNDEIRIAVNQQDIITAPYLSYLHITGTVSGKKADGGESLVNLVNNACLLLFEEMRLEINSNEVCRTKNVGITTLIKGLLSFRSESSKNLENACWFGPNLTINAKTFSFNIPLQHIFGLCDDYHKIFVNCKQELVLLRASSDYNAIISADATSVDLKINSITWKLPRITVNEYAKINLLNMIQKDSIIHIPYRNWELHVNPNIPQTTRNLWNIKTSSQVEKPRYVILAFQKDRKNVISKDASLFDHCGITNVRLYLNGKYFPYQNVNGDQSTFYEMFTRFQSSYYGKSPSTCVSLDDFKTKTPLYVIHSNFQEEQLRGVPSIDVSIEYESSENMKPNTIAYCLIIYDLCFQYSLLSGSVKKVV